MEKIGLVLEGGGMRSVYTGGILEYFLENRLWLPYVIAVSAGACNGASYVSKQRGRNKAVTVDYAGNPQYMSYKRLLRKGELFNMAFIFDQIPNVNNPFDYGTFYQSEQKFFIGTTDCSTGKPIYFEKSELNGDLNTILRASSSLPFASKIVEYGGKALLDGGISDPIPIRKSMNDGNEKHVVILTRCKGYVKESSNKGKWILKRKYREYSGLLESIEKRGEVYNETIQLVEQLEREGKAFVFRPDDLMGVGRTEKRKEKLEALYTHGYEQAKERIEDLVNFIQSPIKQTRKK